MYASGPVFLLTSKLIHEPQIHYYLSNRIFYYFTKNVLYLKWYFHLLSYLVSLVSGSFSLLNYDTIFFCLHNQKQLTFLHDWKRNKIRFSFSLVPSMPLQQNFTKFRQKKETCYSRMNQN